VFFVQKISKLKKKRVLKLLFQGRSYGAVAEIEGVSKSTVKIVYDEFVAETSGSSLEEAAKQYKVSEEVEVLMELASESRRSTLSMPEILVSARLQHS
jgi:transposase